VLITPWNQEYDAEIVSQPIDQLAARSLAVAELAQRPVGSLLTEEEAAAIAKVSKWTVRRLIERGVLKASNFGTDKHKVYRIHPDDLRAVQCPVPPPPPEPRVRRRRIRNAQAVSSDPVWPPVPVSESIDNQKMR
jgi:excisionase family DNA binding protein